MIISSTCRVSHKPEVVDLYIYIFQEEQLLSHFSRSSSLAIRNSFTPVTRPCSLGVYIPHFYMPEKLRQATYLSRVMMLHSRSESHNTYRNSLCDFNNHRSANSVVNVSELNILLKQQRNSLFARWPMKPSCLNNSLLIFTV